MDQINKKTETRKIKKENQTIKRIVNTIFGLIQTLLVFRLIFKVLGANPENEFVKIIYGASEYFISIFKNIFNHIEIGERGVLEPEVIIAMVVISIINGVIMKLLTPNESQRSVETKYIKSDKYKKE